MGKKEDHHFVDAQLNIDDEFCDISFKKYASNSKDRFEFVMTVDKQNPQPFHKFKKKEPWRLLVFGILDVYSIWKGRRSIWHYQKDYIFWALRCRIQKVKCQVMEHMEGAEEARKMVDEAMAMNEE